MILEMDRKKTKGVVQAVFLIMAAGLVLEAILINTFVADVRFMQRASREIGVIATVDTMEFLKKAMQHSVSNAADRASFDVGNRGGYYSMTDDADFYNCKPYWKIYSESFEPTDDRIRQSVENSILKVFECYGKAYGISYSPTGVSMLTPDYSSCGDIEMTDNGENSFDISITNNCGSGLEVSHKQTIVEEMNANFEQDDVKMYVFELADEAKDKFLDSRLVLDAVNDGAASSACRSIVSSESGCMTGSDNDVGRSLIESQCSNWKTKLKDSISAKLSENIEIEGKYLGFSIDRIEATYDVTGCSCDSYEVEVECAEEEPETEPELPDCPTDRQECEGVVGYKCMCGTDICQSNDYCCAGGNTCEDLQGCNFACRGVTTTTEPEEKVCTETRRTTQCDYSYDADVDVVVSVRNDETYAVYREEGGAYQMANPTFKFRIIDGNLGTLGVPEESTCSKIEYC